MHFGQNAQTAQLLTFSFFKFFINTTFLNDRRILVIQTSSPILNIHTCRNLTPPNPYTYLQR